MFEYEDFKVPLMPNSAYYFPNFISEDEEADLLEKIYSSPKPKWKDLSNRRLQNWGGLPHPKGMIMEDLPEWLYEYALRVSDLEIYGNKTANHVLINEYLPGQGIMPHEDGPLFTPTIATINLGSHTVIDYYAKPQPDAPKEKDQLKNNNYIGTSLTDNYVGSLLLERYSLLVVQDDLYHNYLHGIKELTHDEIKDVDLKNLEFCENATQTTLKREKRISLTIRHVPTVRAFKFFLKRK